MEHWRLSLSLVYTYPRPANPGEILGFNHPLSKGRCPMPTYVTLFKWTEQGVRDVKNAPARFEAARKLTESMGGKILGLYVTMGEYDIVAVTEGPSDEVAAATALSIASKGNAKTTTLRAFTESEFSGILKKVV
jgi:uncharacterized protein with GYD domain